MAIQDEMYKMIAQEIDLVVKKEREKVLVDIKKAKEVAKMLTELSVEKTEADSLVNQYMANIKNICNS
jgi:Holliday junction resolvase-like predicted endonuclease